MTRSQSEWVGGRSNEACFVVDVGIGAPIFAVRTRFFVGGWVGRVVAVVGAGTVVYLRC